MDTAILDEIGKEIPHEFFFIVFRVLLDKRGNPTRVSLQIDSDIKLVLQKEAFLDIMRLRSSDMLYQQILRSSINIGEFFLIDAIHEVVKEISRHDIDVRLTPTEISKMVEAEDKANKEQLAQNLATPALDKPFNNLNITNKKNGLSVKPRVFTSKR